MFFVLSAAAFTIIMVIFLTIRQMFCGLSPSRKSDYRTPPRMLFTPTWASKALPVVGHTRFFRSDGGSLYGRFYNHWREYFVFGRRIGACFAVFIWAQWRVLIKGKQRATFFFKDYDGDDDSDHGFVDVPCWARSGIQPIKRKRKMEPAWAFFPPKPLLGSNCPSMMEDQESKDALLNLLGDVLRHEQIIRFSYEFGFLADRFVDRLLKGELMEDEKSKFNCSCFSRNRKVQIHPQFVDGMGRKTNTSDENTNYSNEAEKSVSIEIGSHTLKHFTLDLMNGPLLGLDIWPPREENKDDYEQQQQQQQQQGYGTEDDTANVCKDNDDMESEGDDTDLKIESSDTFKPNHHSALLGEESFDENNGIDFKQGKIPSREKTLTWLKWIKEGLMGFRFTVGGKWMQLWRLNEYGRGIHARNGFIERILSDHITKMTLGSRTQRPTGLFFCDPLTTPYPLFTIANQIQETLFCTNGNFTYKVKRRYSAPLEREPMLLDNVRENNHCNYQRIAENESRNSSFTIDKHNKNYVKNDVENDICGAISQPLSIHSIITDEEDDGKGDNDRYPPNSFIPKNAKNYDKFEYSPVPCPVETDAGVAGQGLTHTGLMNYHHEMKNLHMSGGTDNSTNESYRESIESASFTEGRIFKDRANTDTELYIKRDLDSMKEQKYIYGKNTHQVINASYSSDVDATNMQNPEHFNLLHDLFLVKDDCGDGISQAAITDICLLLWLSLDAGCAWTSMALHLLQRDPNALQSVRNELNHIENLINMDSRIGLWTQDEEEDGNNYRATESVNKKFFMKLSEAKYLDAVIYEAIRLCPPFCGGMWKTAKTVELDGDKLQVPAGTNVLFSSVTTRPFDLEYVWGRNAKDFVESYPCRHLYGFLPLDGLEIPLMVLQSKILLAAILRRCDICPKSEIKDPIENSKQKQHERKQQNCEQSSSSFEGAGDENSKMDNGRSCVHQVEKTDQHLRRWDVTKKQGNLGFDNACKNNEEYEKEDAAGEDSDLGMEYCIDGLISCSTLHDQAAAEIPSDDSFTTLSKDIVEIEDGGIPIDFMCDLSSASSCEDKVEISTESASTALKLRSFDTGYKNVELDPGEDSDLSFVESQKTILPYWKKATQQNKVPDAQSEVTLKECWSWFTKFPFPESIDSVPVTARNRPS